MEQYIPKSAVVAEIDERIASLESIGSENYLHDNCPEQYAMLVTLKSLKFSIDTLEVKEVDLEKYYHEFLQKEWFGNSHVRTVSEMMAFTAKHFFELGLYSQLSWQDIRKIAEIGEEFMNSEESDNLSEEEYYTAILDKLKEKGRDYKTDRQEIRDLVQKGE